MSEPGGVTDVLEYDCVYCGDPIQSPHEHHRRQHPSLRYDPVWYHEVNVVGPEGEPRESRESESNRGVGRRG